MTARGFSVNENALFVIQVCDDWYSNREVKDFHTRKNLNGEDVHLARLNFAKRACADDANLCEVIDITTEETSAAEDFIDNLLEKNRFDVRYREQLEKTSATGTVGAYIYLRNAEFYESNGTTTARGGEIKINYCDADCIIPLTVDNHLVTECAFASTNIYKGKEQTTLVIFTQDERGLYTAETVYFDNKGNRLEERGTTVQLGDVKPFAIMTNAEVNNIDNMEGYGLPKIYNSIPFFKAIDLCYNLLYGDLDKGDKLVFINELLAAISKDENGQPVLTPQQKKLFILLGEKLPSQENLVKEYNPEIRTAQITEAFELVLSLISMQFGYGTRKYSFENGQITTATEYIGEKQDQVQELNKQRKQATDYITDIVRAALWFSNTFQGTSYDTNEALQIEFDDSYIEDKQTRLDGMRNDAMTFVDIPWLLEQYLIEKYNLSEEEVAEIMAGRSNQYADDITTDDGEIEPEDDTEIDLESILADLDNWEV